MGKGKVISIVSAKGGVGKTVISLNLALSLLKDYGKKVLAVDTNIISPNLHLYLGIIDIIPFGIHHALRDPEIAEDCVYIHTSSGLHIIPAPLTKSEKISLKNLKNVVDKLRDRYDYIIIDTAPNVEKDLEDILEASDEILVVINPWLPIIVSNLRVVKTAEKAGIPIKIIVNKAGRDKAEMTEEEIRDSLGHEVFAKIPVDIEVYRGVERRKPLIINNPKARASVAIRNLAKLLIKN